MSVNSMSFVIFLPLVVGINFIIPRRYRYVWLCLASYVFYLSNDWRFLVGLGTCSVISYVVGIGLEHVEANKKKWILGMGILGNLLLLGVFRYTIVTDFFVPLGLSFYGLQAMGYLVDVYRGQIHAEQNILKFSLFVAFFPTIMSGPIQKATTLLPQIQEGRDFDYDRAHAGLYQLLKGYLLKMVIANQLLVMVDFAYNDYQNMPGATLLWATVLYAIQLYCDFAGYSALALGAGKLLGFDLGENFRQPYFAVSIKDFWRRWHISLSSWLRDYVYIPLGGNRKGEARKALNLMLTFLVSGLWHGTGLQFFVWGGLHGIYQVIEDRLPKQKKAPGLPVRLIRMGVTFVLVDFAWLFFRAGSLQEALEILQRIFFAFDFKGMTYYGTYRLGVSQGELLFVLLGMSAVFVVDLLHERQVSVRSWAESRLPLAVRWTAYVALTLLILFVVVKNYGLAAATFIYARF